MRRMILSAVTLAAYFTGLAFGAAACAGEPVKGCICGDACQCGPECQCPPVMTARVDAGSPVGSFRFEANGDAAFVLSTGKFHGWYIAKEKLFYPYKDGVYGKPFPYTQTASPPVYQAPTFQPFGGFFRGGCAGGRCGG